MVHLLAETAAAYRTEPRVPHTKLSISLPTDLVEALRAAAAESGIGVSGVVAAAVRQAVVGAEQERLDRALALDADANVAWAKGALELTARAWAALEW